MQREVAERIVAQPGSKAYGRLSVLSGWRTQAKILFDINPSAFVPPPKVTSSVVEFIPRANPLNGAAEIEEKRLWNDGLNGAQDLELLYDHARAKWDAWKTLAGTATDAAQQQYIDLIESLKD